jgi:hypothetical protein
MNITAIFKSIHDLGYIKGQTYNLTFDLDTHSGDDVIEIQEITKGMGSGSMQLRSDSEREYRSLKSFLDTWDVIN